MKFSVIQRILGLLSMLFSITFVPPMLVSWGYSDGMMPAFISAFFVVLLFGAVIWWPVRLVQAELRVRDGFLVVVTFWVGLGLLGAIPLLLAEFPDLSLSEAVFESISGLTTTGATIIVGLDVLPESLLYYRQQLQWLGGMGIIVLAVAVMPMLGIGGMQLYRAETPGPIKDSKLTPRITETAKTLWYIYLGLTVLCGLAYWLAGMSGFDAIGHAFSTVAIGGFSTHDASMAYFDSALIESIAIFFMLLSGVNFALHFMSLRVVSIKPYLQDPECMGYLKLTGFVVIVTCLTLWVEGVFETGQDVIRAGVFQVVSIATTTGFTTHAYSDWPVYLPVLLLFASFVGGCVGSTGGGIKVMRAMLLLRQGVREVFRLIHPNAQVPVKLGSRVIPARVIEAVWGFFSVYVLVFVVIFLGFLGTGLDQVSAFSAVAACMNNLGPGLGAVSNSFAAVTDVGKWLAVLAMLLGRLEIFTLLVLFTPAFWQR